MSGIAIDESECDKRKITKPESTGDIARLLWAPQVTAPMPLEAVQELFRKVWTKEPSHLLPSKHRESIRKKIFHVTGDFFQASPGGLSGGALKDDILGFFSLVLSYAKAKLSGDEEHSIKQETSIMPRNDFFSMYGLLRSQNRIPSFKGSLFDLFKVLACYKNKDDGTVEYV